MKLLGEFREVATIFISFAHISELDKINQFMGIILTALAQFGGYFSEMDFGDKGGVLVIYFGAPITSEKDIERALAFLLHLQKALANLNILWRAGINYGTVYTGYTGSPLRDKYTCMGSIVNLSARFMMTAKWGEILVGQTITQTTNFNFTLLGELSFKGFSHPIPTFQLIGHQIRKRIFNSKMVGRQGELEQLTAFTNDRLGIQVSMGVICIYGPAGIGKSHLTHQLKNTLPPNIKWLTGQSDSILRLAFNPFIYFLTTVFPTNAKCQ